VHELDCITNALQFRHFTKKSDCFQVTMTPVLTTHLTTSPPNS